MSVNSHFNVTQMEQSSLLYVAYSQNHPHGRDAVLSKKCHLIIITASHFPSKTMDTFPPSSWLYILSFQLSPKMPSFFSPWDALHSFTSYSAKKERRNFIHVTSVRVTRFPRLFTLTHILNGTLQAAQPFTRISWRALYAPGASLHDLRMWP